MEPACCADCGSEFFHLGDGPAPTQCEDCARKGLVVERIGSNVRELRVAAGVDHGELADRTGLDKQSISALERGAGGEPGVLKAIRIADSLGVSIGELTAGVYWYPGEIASSGQRRPPAVRLNGFFSVLPSRLPAFDLSPPCPPVPDRRVAAETLGANIRAARERRHLRRVDLAAAAGLTKDGLLKIELGRTETTIARLFALARALQVAPEVLLDRIAWEPSAQLSTSSGRAHHKPESLDAAIKRLWAEDRSAAEIAELVDSSPGSVAAIVSRLRDQGERLAYRNDPTSSLQERARQRRPAGPTCDRPTEATGGDPAEEASKAEIAGRIAANIKIHRQRAGLTPPQLMEAIEDREQRGWELERYAVPQLGLLIRLAASLNVGCELISAGVTWEPSEGCRVRAPEPPADIEEAMQRRLGRNLQEARRRLGVSQAAVGASAHLGRSDVAELEGGKRPLRFFALVRVAGVLGVGLDDLFAGIADWYLSPLPAPEFEPGTRPSKSERDETLARLWRAGRPEREIAEALDLTVGTVAPYVRELRDAGVDLPYRRPPRCQAEERARRRRAGIAMPDAPGQMADRARRLAEAPAHRRRPAHPNGESGRSVAAEPGERFSGPAGSCIRDGARRSASGRPAT